MVRPAPSVMTQGENARLTCQVPRTNDFFIAPSKWFVVPAMGTPRRSRRGTPLRGPISPLLEYGSPLALDGGPNRSHYFAWPSRIARQSRSGVAGISMCRTPRWESASTNALATAGMAPTQPASPAPLTPSGLVLVGTGLLFTSTALISLARGMA